MEARHKESFKRRYWGTRPWTRHSMVIFVAGGVYTALGLSYIFEVTSPERARAVEIAVRVLPLTAWGYVFVICGMAALISTRWPPSNEKWGYTVLAGLSAGWAAVYVLSIAVGHSAVTNMPAALVWCLMAFLWWAISGLSNPPAVSCGRC